MKNLLTLFASLCMVFLFGCASPNTGTEAGHAGVFEGKPRINAPHVVGNYPSTPFLFYIPTSGLRPVTWSAENLPDGLALNPETGIISGSVKKAGVYAVKLTAKNPLGSTAQNLTISIGNDLALTPPMGWNSWNTFGQHLTEALIIETADAMIANGMRDLGYTYINIDDFWQLVDRGEDGRMQINREKFPNGIKHVADYLHARGFKLGIYSDAAERTCGGVCGSYGYEDIDALDFAAWGVDYLKYDYCGAPQKREVAIERYSAMGKALRKTDRSIVYSICEWGINQPWLWAKGVGGHCWRTTWDIRDRWMSPTYTNETNGVLNIIGINGDLDQYAGPGGWNDPDMLIVGISGKSQSINHGDVKEGCSDEQYRSHMSMWAMMAAPLLCGNDVRNMSAVTLETLTNPEIIAINQDALGKQGQRKINTEALEVWVKELSDGSKAIACLNKTGNPVDLRLGKGGIISIGTNAEIRDVWTHRNLGKIQSLDVHLSPYECKVYTVK